MLLSKWTKFEAALLYFQNLMNIVTVLLILITPICDFTAIEQMKNTRYKLIARKLV